MRDQGEKMMIMGHDCVALVHNGRLSVNCQHIKPHCLESMIGKFYKCLRTFLVLHEKGASICQASESLFDS